MGNPRDYIAKQAEYDKARESQMCATTESIGGQAGCLRRPTAQEELDGLISSFRLKVNQLEALRRALPLELPLPADEALRDLIITAVHARR